MKMKIIINLLSLPLLKLGLGSFIYYLIAKFILFITNFFIKFLKILFRNNKFQK